MTANRLSLNRTINLYCRNIGKCIFAVMNASFRKSVLLFFSTGIFSCQIAFAQTQKPKLVIGIVVDQMRNDYISRYWDKFETEGIKKLVNQGFRFENMHYEYVPTYTAPGHATIYTGTNPSGHGVVANDWYDRKRARKVYCTEDSAVSSVGSIPGKSGQMSPRNMLAGTIGDELRNYYKDRSKVIGIALKDRGAILPAGHSANAAYWFDGESGNWISSTYYMTELPSWLQNYNSKQLAKAYLEKEWTTLLPKEAYTESLPDDNPYETPFKGMEKAVFPYDLKKLAETNGKLNLIRSTPWGNTLTMDLAKTIIQEEELGKDQIPDLLCVSFSSTDYVGHQFGPDAIEMEDAYLRFDRDLAELIRFAEEKVGREGLLVFLTADHGGATIPAYLRQRKQTAGYLDGALVIDSVKAWIKSAYAATDWLLEWNNDQIYLNESKINSTGIKLSELELFLCRKLEGLPGIRSAFASTDLRRYIVQGRPGSLVQQGHYAKRSGNIQLVLDPSWMEYSHTGTTHGSSYNYDTHVPMLWYGINVNHGSSLERVSVADIAPTLSHLLGIPLPNAASGQMRSFKSDKR
jgi:predicted AlkP superfamily pyrophosphatase or phosphodiesterase